MIFDPMYFVFIAPGVILSLIASGMVQSAFAKWSQVGSYNQMTGAQAAYHLLQRAGIYDVEIVQVPGSLTDHYDPSHKKLALSDDVYGSTSVAAIGVATHEAGHAIQHATGYSMLALRSAIVGPASFGASFAPWIIIGGAVMSNPMLIKVGIVLFSAMVLFQLVTLPVEFDASNRAKRLVVEAGIVLPEERQGIDKVLNAAALTYVAAAITGFLTLLFYIWRFSSRD